MVKDNYMLNKLDSITITRRGIDTGYINSSVVVSGTRSVILEDVINIYLFNNAPTRSIGMFVVLLRKYNEPIRSNKVANIF